jgi:predicted nucleic acid-binding protein
MSAVYCDTSALYALLDRSDANAQDAVKSWDGLVEASIALVTTNYVVLETIALVQARLGMGAVTALRSLVDPFISVHYVDAPLHLAALEQVVSLSRRAVSLVDCASFAFMRQHGISRAFAFDRHFREFGFGPAF